LRSLTMPSVSVAESFDGDQGERKRTSEFHHEDSETLRLLP
jgi:hypothetical protein